MSGYTASQWLPLTDMYLHVLYCCIYVLVIFIQYILQSKIHIIILVKLLLWNNSFITPIYTIANYAHILNHKCIKFSRKPRPPQFSLGSQSRPL